MSASLFDVSISLLGDGVIDVEIVLFDGVESYIAIANYHHSLDEYWVDTYHHCRCHH